MKSSPCKGCGKPIVWGITPTGQRVPLDPKPVIYRVSVLSDGEILCQRDIPMTNLDSRVESIAMVSHFATCAKANDFSASKKKKFLHRSPREGAALSEDANREMDLPAGTDWGNK